MGAMMNNFSQSFPPRTHGLVRATVAFLAFTSAIVSPGTSRADWIESVLDQRCDPADISGVTSEVRTAIEASVRRSEATIQAPSSIGDLSCLNDLMTAPLDTFSNLGGIIGSLQTGLERLSKLDLNLDMNIAGNICSLAAEKWAELTAPLSEIEGTIEAFAATPADAASRLAQGGFGSNGNKTMMPSFSGVSRTDSSGNSGSIRNYTVPDTSVSDSTRAHPIRPNYPDTANVSAADLAAYEAASRSYNEDLMASVADYMSCRFARSLDGTYVSGGFMGGVWDVPGSGACTFSGPSVPSILTQYAGASEAAPETAATAQETAAEPVEEAVDGRAYGQDMSASTETEGGDDTSEISPVTPETAPQNIWQMLGTGTPGN